MASTIVDIETLYRACRNIETYYAAAAELVSSVGWQPGVTPSTPIPGIPDDVAQVIRGIADDDNPVRPPCPIFPKCNNVPGWLLDRIGQLQPQAAAVTIGLRAVGPYFGPRPDVSTLLHVMQP